MASYTPVMPHGPLDEVFPGVYVCTGTTMPQFAGETWQFSRNMTVVRDGESLSLVNTVRLDDAGLAALDALGKVENVVKIGAFHGYDDEFYLDRYGAKLWGLPGVDHECGRKSDADLTPESLPIAGASLFVFETSSKPECLLVLDREGGIVLACDSVQNWTEADKFFSEASAEKMGQFGFFRKANLGPGWMRTCEPDVTDFERLKALEFRHLLSAHGAPLKDTAHADLSATIADVFAG